MPRVPRVRHVGYTADSIPIVRRMFDVECEPFGLDLAGRQVAYTAAGVPILAYAWVCCDLLCTAEEYEDESCWVEADCWPFGPGPGIPKRLKLYAVEVDNCVSVRDKVITLTYFDDGNPPSARPWAGPGLPLGPGWLGTMAVRDQTADFKFVCNEDEDPDSSEKFTLYWSDCEYGFQNAPFSCQDPLRVDFAQIPWNECCDCTLVGPYPEGTPKTDITSTVNFIVVGDCFDHPVRAVHHVGYTAEAVPIVTPSKVCGWDVAYQQWCEMMRCGIYAELTGEGDCSCIDATYPLDYTDAADAWNFFQSAGECLPVEIGATCTNMPPDEDHPDGFLRLSVSITCDEFNTGSGFTDIDFDELADLDVVVDVTMIWAGSPPDPDPEPACCEGVVHVRLIRP